MDLEESFESTQNNVAMTTTTTLFTGLGGNAGTHLGGLSGAIAGAHVGKLDPPVSGRTYLTLAHNKTITSQTSRIYGYLATWPTQLATVVLMMFWSNALAARGATVGLTTSRTLSVTGSTTVTGAVVIPLATWFRLEMQVTGTTLKARVFIGTNVHGDTPNEEVVATNPSGRTFDSAEFGICDVTAQDRAMWVDSFRVVDSAASWIGAAGGVLLRETLDLLLNNATLTAANTSFDLFTGTATSSWQARTADSIAGGVSARGQFTGSNETVSMGKTYDVGYPLMRRSAYLKFTTTPTVAGLLMTFQSTAGNLMFAYMNLSRTVSLWVDFAVRATSATVLPLNDWFRIEMKGDSAAGVAGIRLFVGANRNGTVPDEEIQDTNWVIPNTVQVTNSVQRDMNAYVDSVVDYQTDWLPPPAAPLAPVGAIPLLGVKLRAVQANGTAGVFLPDFTTLEFSDTYQDRSVLTVTYKRGGRSAATLITDRQQVALFSEKTELLASRCMALQFDGDEVAEDSPTFGMTCLNWVWQRLAETVYFPQDLLAPTDLPFNNSNAGSIMTSMISTAQASRGALGGMVVDFSIAVDSNGNPWQYAITTTVTVGTSFDQVLQSLIDMGVVEVGTRGRTLRLFNPGGMGTYRDGGTSPIILRAGREFVDAPKRRDAGAVITASLVQGESTATAKSTANFGGDRIEAYQNFSETNDIATLGQLAQAQLDYNNQPKTEFTHALTLASGGYLPWKDYWVGDWVLRDVAGVRQSVRVRQLTVTYSADDVPSATITLGDRFDPLPVRLARQVSQLTGVAKRLY